MIPYACKVCGRLDEEGITGHATNRCKPLGKIVKAVANKAANTDKPVANKRGVYKNKEKRLEYMRELMRKKREAKRANLRPH